MEPIFLLKLNAMQKQIFLTTLMVVLAAGCLLAQARQIAPTPQRTTSLELPTAQLQPRADMDTLFFQASEEACAETVFTFTINDEWGYVAGMNGYEDLEKAQRLDYTASGPYLVREVWAFFAEVSVVGDGPLRMKVYDANGSTGGPGALLGQSIDLNVSDLEFDETAILLTIFPLTTPATVNDDEFFVSCDFSDLYATQDTVALFMTDDGCGDGADSWELFGDGQTWLPINSGSSWSLDANWLLAAVVELDEMTSTDQPFVAQRGLRLLPATPNPADEWVQINYELEQSSRVQIEVYSADGRLLQRIQQGQQLAGQYNERLNVQHLASGAYVYGIVTDNARLMSRFVVNRQ